MKTELNFRAVTPKAIMLNKPLLLGLGGLALFFIFWLVIIAFKAPKHPESQSSLIAFENNGNRTISPLIAELPKNYQDTEAVKKFLTPAPTIPPEVTQEIENLRTETSSLQNEVAELKAPTLPPPAAVTPPVDQDTSEARKSTIFPTAGAPPTDLFSNETKAVAANSNTSSTNSSTTSAYAQQNMQNQKNDFLQNTAEQGGVYNKYNMIQPESPYEVQAGTIIAANLLTAINTSLPGDVVAQVRQDVYDTVSGRYLLVPKGSKLLGKYDSSVAYGQQRVLITYHRIIRPDGSSIQLNNFTGSDSMGESGFAADVDNHWGKILGAATISTLLSFGAGVAADHNTGNNPYYPSAQQGAVLGAANSIAQTGQTLTNKAIDIQPTLTVPAGFNFNVIVNKDMVLSPYAGKTL